MRGLIYTIILAIIFSFMIGCKAKTVYVPVESVKTEYRDKLTRDSIYFKELVRIYQKGDTIFKDSIIYKYKDRFVKDTVNVTDTIRIPYPVKGDTIYVDKELSWLDKTQIYIGRISVCIILILLGVKYRLKIIQLFKWLIKILGFSI